MASRILIVDDKESVLEFLELVFERHGFEVIKTDSGEEAIALARKELPDIMLVDVMMPEVDGLEVCRRLRSDNVTSDLTILLYSSAAGDEIRDQIRAAGGDAFLGKTLNHAELVTQVRNWLVANSKPGGIGHPSLVKVALDVNSMLQVDLVWILSQSPEGLVHLAIACEQGEQEARRFLESVGRGPFSLDKGSMLGFVMAEGKPRLGVPLQRVRATVGGKEIGEAMGQLGAQKISFAPLRIPSGGRGLMLFSGFSTLEIDRHSARLVEVARGYISAAIALWGSSGAGNPLARRA